MQIEFNATKRTLQGTGASRRLRGAGRFPGVVYGANQPAVSIEFDHNELFHMLKREAFHASVLTMNLEGAKELVILRDVQRHPFRMLVLHCDFQRVDANQKLHMKVPLHFINAENAPGVKTQGGNVSHVISELEVSCLPASLPEFLTVDLKDLAAGHSIHASQIALPAGVELALNKGEDPVVAAISIPRGAAAAAETEEAK